jgi:hypothetical protein
MERLYTAYSLTIYCIPVINDYLKYGHVTIAVALAKPKIPKNGEKKFHHGKPNYVLP